MSKLATLILILISYLSIAMTSGSIVYATATGNQHETKQKLGKLADTTTTQRELPASQPPFVGDNDSENGATIPSISKESKRLGDDQLMNTRMKESKTNFNNLSTAPIDTDQAETLTPIPKEAIEHGLKEAITPYDTKMSTTLGKLADKTTTQREISASQPPVDENGDIIPPEKRASMPAEIEPETLKKISDSIHRIESEISILQTYFSNLEKRTNQLEEHLRDQVVKYDVILLDINRNLAETQQNNFFNLEKRINQLEEHILDKIGENYVIMLGINRTLEAIILDKDKKKVTVPDKERKRNEPKKDEEKERKKNLPKTDGLTESDLINNGDKTENQRINKSYFTGPVITVLIIIILLALCIFGIIILLLCNKCKTRRDSSA
ncbi:hypothetical protein QYM36_009876 [Artemia franciscana]|uniref:Uncharacterized protein n=1 Tax=Artemia franciscana TaxID=6661 RepID=A0AA88I434_ARTSF|nr:hypothetical protein QYM36_009876 [Artemia franciscana]